MAWTFDHDELAVRAATLRAASNDLAATRAAILSRLGSVGRYSGSAAALSTAVSAMGTRASDLDARVVHLDGLADRVRQQLNVDHFRSALLTPPPPTEEERLTALLAEAVADIKDNPGSLFDGTLLAKVGRATLLASQLRSHREQLLNDALENRRIAMEIGTTGAWVDVMRSGAEAEILKLSGALGITREDLFEVAVAMRSGLSPSESGIPSYLFPADYVVRMEEAAALQTEIADAREALDMLRAATRVAWIEERNANGIFGGLVLRDHDYRAKEQAYRDALELEDAASERLEELERRLGDLNGPVSRESVHDYLAGLPFVSVGERSRLVGDYLGAAWVQATLDFVETDEHVEILELLAGHDPVTSASFFNALGPSEAYLTANTALSMFVDVEQSEAMLRILSETLGNASRSGELQFTGAELINGMDDEYLAVGVVDPAWLFAYGDFSDEFLVSGTVAIIERDEFGAFIGMQNIPEGFLADAMIPAAQDGRILLMSRLADRPETSATLVSQLSDDGLLVDLLGDDFIDDGIAVGDILANLVEVSGPEGLAATTSAVTALAALESDGRSVNQGVAIGAAVMVAPHIDSFVPSVDRLEELGPLYIPGELPTGDLRAALEAEGMDAQGTLEDLMHVVLGEDLAAEVFVASMLTFNYQTLQSVADPANPDARHEYTNDLAGLEGLTSAIWIDEHLSDSADEDARNEAIRFWTGLLTSAAVTTAAFFFAPATIAGSAGAAAIAKFGVGQVINNGVKELFTNEIFPTDNVERAQMDAITALTQRDPYGYAVLQALSDQGALVDETTGEMVHLEIDLADLGSIDTTAFGELLGTITVIDPATGEPSAVANPLDWFTGGAFLTVQEITEVIGAYLGE